jgi:argininosuccinate lyase
VDSTADEEKRDMLLRGSRLGDISSEVLDFISSRDADLWIAEADVLVDMAHLLMLYERGLIQREDCARILTALKELLAEGFDVLGEGEDIHEAIEAYVIERVGPAGGRMHTARSRNDEVATCIRIALREQMLGLMDELLQMIDVLVQLADETRERIIPGYTHLQHAQPTTLAHHLLAHADALIRDLERFEDAYERVNLSPLGAAAFASTGFEIDRHMTCELLGFSGIVENSMDAVSGRDFALEVLADTSILMINLSRIAEEIILWSTAEFGYVEVDDLFASTSSIMPQKKNPDTAELVRAKSGTVIGSMVGALSICKALPMSYNRDLQELTPHIWRGIGAARSSLRVMKGCMSTLRFDFERLERSSTDGFTTATELADSIVRITGIPFRTAHQIVGRIARLPGKPSLEDLDRIAMEVANVRLSMMGFTAGDLERALDARTNVAMRARPGGPAPAEVSRMLDARKKYLKSASFRLRERRARVESAISHLMELVDRTACSS